MFIIVEGPDGAGKTTVVEQLRASMPGTVVLHFGAPETEQEAANYWKVYAKAIFDNKDTMVCIFDRAWPSDMVYGPIIRNKVEIDEIAEKTLSTLIRDNGGGYILYCKATHNIMWRRCRSRGETFITDKEVHAAISKKYESVMTKMSLPVIVYDTSKPLRDGTQS